MNERVVVLGVLALVTVADVGLLHFVKFHHLAELGCQKKEKLRDTKTCTAWVNQIRSKGGQNKKKWWWGRTTKERTEVSSNRVRTEGE